MDIRAISPLLAGVRVSGRSVTNGRRLPAVSTPRLVGAPVRPLRGLGAAPAAGSGSAVLSLSEARQLADETLADMGLEGQATVNLVGTLLTSDNVKTAAINTGIGLAEMRLQQATGVPIRLPRKLTLEELEQTITGVIPTNAMEAIDLAITLGSQYVASAVTSLLIGAGLGSVVPGLGTIVGIGVALGVGALRDALAEGPQPYERACETPMTVCPPVPGSDPLMLVFTAAQRTKALEESLAEEQSRRYCGRGPLVDCNNHWSLVLRLAYEASYPTIGTLGSGQVDYYLSVFEHAPTSKRVFNPYPGHERIEDSSISQVGFVKQRLADRRSQLDRFIALGDSVATMPEAQLEQFRWNLYREELPRAALAYQSRPNDTTLAWLVRVSGYKDAVAQRDAGRTGRLATTMQQSAEQAAQALSTEEGRLASAMEQQQFLCGGGDRGACSEYERLRGQLDTLRSANRAQFCRAVVDQWKKDNPREARCLSPEASEQLATFCANAFARPDETARWLEAWGQLVARECATRPGAIEIVSPTKMSTTKKVVLTTAVVGAAGTAAYLLGGLRWLR